MGMAASQARFLGLTARQNNTEYEGQQINQSRTMLANQSANYYNQLLGMKVPTPPSATDFTKTVYSFQDGNLTNSITTMIAQPGGKYLVNYIQSYTDDFTPVSAGNVIATQIKDEKDIPTGKYRVGAVELRQLGSNGENGIKIDTDEKSLYLLQVIEDGKYYKEKMNEKSELEYSEVDNKWLNDNKNKYFYFKEEEVGKDNDGKPIMGKVLIEDKDLANYKNTSDIPYLKDLTLDQVRSTIEEEDLYIGMLNTKFDSTEWYVRYLKNNATGTWAPNFYKKDAIENAQYGPKGESLSSIPAYMMGSAQITEEVKGKTATLERDTTGRFINITLDEQGVTYSLTTNTVKDDDAYNDAMNQYEFDKAQYDKAIQDVNAKIEVIQNEDKNLELRLKQLDTEQEALQQEKEAVQKVVEENVKSTFKTFA